MKGSKMAMVAVSDGDGQATVTANRAQRDGDFRRFRLSLILFMVALPMMFGTCDAMRGPPQDRSRKRPSTSLKKASFLSPSPEKRKTQF